MGKRTTSSERADQNQENKERNAMKQKEVTLKKIVKLITSQGNQPSNAFDIRFYKKNGDMRKMTARYGDTEHLRGGELPYNVADHGLLTVFDTEIEQYRAINISGIIDVIINGITYKNKSNIVKEEV